MYYKRLQLHTPHEPYLNERVVFYMTITYGIDVIVYTIANQLVN